MAPSGLRSVKYKLFSLKFIYRYNHSIRLCPIFYDEYVALVRFHAVDCGQRLSLNLETIWRHTDVQYCCVALCVGPRLAAVTCF